MWDPPGPGLEPVSPALAGGFLTTARPGKSYIIILMTDYSFNPGVASESCLSFIVSINALYILLILLSKLIVM